MNTAEAHDYATRVLVQLTKPLNPVYKDANEFLYDFWADMPWTIRESMAVASQVLSDENLRAIVRAFDVRHALEGDLSVEIGMMATCVGIIIGEDLI